MAPMSATAELAQALPKAELHIHIEGTLEPEMMFELAGRNDVRLPFGDVAAIRAAYDFADLQSFLDLYYAGAAVLQTEQDFSDLAHAYLRRAAADSVRHVEMFFDPQTHTERGIPFAVVVDGLRDGIARSHSAGGPGAELIMCWLRHLSEESAMETLDQAMAHRDAILGVGLDSSELGHPPAKFERVYRSAAEAGLRLVAHAGEEAPPMYVWQALDILGVERIDHGVRAIEDAALVARIAADDIPLTMCPISNKKLQATPDLARHPMPALIDAGVTVSINSDDPAYFGGYIADNYTAAADEIGLSSATLVEVAKSSFRSSFLDTDAAAAHIAEVDAVATNHGVTT